MKSQYPVWSEEVKHCFVMFHLLNTMGFKNILVRGVKDRAVFMSLIEGAHEVDLEIIPTDKTNEEFSKEWEQASKEFNAKLAPAKHYQDIFDDTFEGFPLQHFVGFLVCKGLIPGQIKREFSKSLAELN